MSYPAVAGPVKVATVLLVLTKSVLLRQYFRRKDAADYIQVCMRTLDQLKADGDMPFCKVGATVVFMKQDLDAFMMKQRIAIGE